jgi:hypothetical protein
MATVYQGRVFDRLPGLYDHRRKSAARYITDLDRARAASVSSRIWEYDPEQVLDQGDWGHCGGLSFATWGNCLPIDDNFTSEDGHKIYYEAVAIGHSPGSEDGATIDWCVKAMRARGRLKTWAYAPTAEDFITWLATKGPGVIGSDWYAGLMEPDATGLIKIGGRSVGGHAWAVRGFDRLARVFHGVMAWGKDWARRGFFTIGFDDFEYLYDRNGEICLAVELELAPEPYPVPGPTGKGCAGILGL